jgi:hypothetical protein
MGYIRNLILLSHNNHEDNKTRTLCSSKIGPFNGKGELAKPIGCGIMNR